MSCLLQAGLSHLPLCAHSYYRASIHVFSVCHQVARVVVSLSNKLFAKLLACVPLESSGIVILSRMCAFCLAVYFVLLLASD